MKKFNYTWSEAIEGKGGMKDQLVQAVKMTVSQINREYLIKLSGDGYNQLLGVGGLLEMVGLQRASKMIERANRCDGDVCRCKVYGGVLISLYIH